MRGSIARWCIAVTAALALASGGAACDGASHRAATGTQGSGSTDEPVEYLSVGPPPKGKPVRGFCGRAVAKVGRDPSTIDVTAWCAPSDIEPYVRIWLGRYRLHDPAAPPLLRPGRIQRVFAEGPGKTSLAKCKSFYRAIMCGAKARGPIRLRAVLAVPPRSRCHLEVSVTTEFEDTCPHNSCIGTMTTYALYSGRPKGC